VVFPQGFLHDISTEYTASNGRLMTE
jgi:hypothetical protein